MITQLKEIPFKQTSLYGGYFYTLAHMLNNENIIYDKDYYRNINLTSYHKNRLFHKFTNQYSRPLIYLEKSVSIPIYSVAYIQPKYKKLFKFEDYVSVDYYKSYIVEIYLTPNRKHYILLIKNLGGLIVVDSMNDFILEMTEDDFFNEYYPIGYEEFIHKYDGEILNTFDEIKHLVN